MALPLRGPSAVGGPLMEAYNALQNAYLDRQKKELVNRYYGPTAEANALSKAAYAKWAGPMALASLMQTPGLAESMGKDQYNALIRSAQQEVANAPNIQVPHAEPQGQGLGSRILNSLFGQQQQRQQQPQNALYTRPNK
jgi:hypothetical protein